MKTKALILYISKYSGHFHGARAIEKGLCLTRSDTEVKLINAIEYTNPILGKIVNRTYLEIIKKRPELWGNIYDNPDVLKKTKTARGAIHKYNMSKIKRLMEKHKPDVVICTQAFPCGMVADYKKTSGSKIPLIGVLTDYAPHSYWLYDEIDYYVVPSSEIAHKLETKGVPRKKFKIYGIPVDPKFRTSHDKRRIRGELGFSGKDPLLLIMGGSQGIGAMEEVVKQLLADERHNYQLLIIAGKNRRLYNRLSRVARRTAENMKVLRYVENIDELMEASDAIVTKAGGLTMAEALVKKLPILIIDPIPGHERMNADYLVNEGVAVEIDNFSGFHEQINSLFNSNGALLKMSERAAQLSKPESSLDIAKLAFQGL
ncbi:MAG: glycosyltransferase [Candidatus Omnitrophota bacterium]